MRTELDKVLTPLAKGALLRLHDGQGHGLAVFEGHVWVTQDDDRRDHLVQRGESFVFDRPGLAIVHALDDSRVLLFDTAAPAIAGAAHRTR
jgi:Protein of unknown function (DUF2917)